MSRTEILNLIINLIIAIIRSREERGPAVGRALMKYVEEVQGSLPLGR